MDFNDYKDLVKIAGEHKFDVTSTNGGAHNVGSKHYLGLAIDVRTRNKTAKQCSDFMKTLREQGLVVRDERIRPPGQKVWGGPHLHIEIVSTKKSAINKDVLLKVGSKGEPVKTLQNRLVKLGFLKPDDIDGEFGAVTKAAVIDFQKLFGLIADGIVGTETKVKLAAVLQRLA